jgi:hypothetical protein
MLWRARSEPGERFRVKDVFWQHVLPLGGVTLTVVVLTLSLFDVPPRAREQVLGLRVPASAMPVASSSVARAHVNDTLREVLRTLDEGRKPTPDPVVPAVVAQKAAPAPQQSAAAAAAAPAAPVNAKAAESPADPELLRTANSLGEAVKAIHDARSEEDLLRAEELVRVVREHMEANCATAPGPMCQSAEQIRSLGY